MGDIENRNELVIESNLDQLRHVIVRVTGSIKLMEIDREEAGGYDANARVAQPDGPVFVANFPADLSQTKELPSGFLAD